MMKLELITGKNGNIKMITKSNNQRKNPLLVTLADFFREANKTSKIKVGVYAIYGSQFSKTISVYSFISGNVEKMDKKKYHLFLNGRKQMTTKPWAKILKGNKKEMAEVSDLFTVIK